MVTGPTSDDGAVQVKVIVFVVKGRLCSMNCTGALAGQPELPRRLPFSQITICEARL